MQAGRQAGRHVTKLKHAHIPPGSCLLPRPAGARVASIHGDMDQHTRMHTLADFKAGKFHALVATDVAARGLDIKSIKTVRMGGRAGGDLGVAGMRDMRDEG